MFLFRFRKKDKTEDLDKTVPKHRRRLQQFKNICKKITTFLFSRVGLCFLVIGYVVVGGFIFKSIEGTHEQEERARNSSLINDIDSSTELLVHEIWNMTKFELVFHEKNYTMKLKSRLIDYQKNLSNAVKQGYKGNSHLNNTKWTYPGSILYSVTIVTTIGYGHITCITDAGKIATIFYAIIGIPMMLLCLANIGSSMANLFRFLYARVCCGYCNYVKKRNIRMKTASHANVVSYAALATTNLILSSNGQNLNDKIQNMSANQNITINPSEQLNQDINSLNENKNLALTDATTHDKKSLIATIGTPQESTYLKNESLKSPSSKVLKMTNFKAGANEAEIMEIYDDNASIDYKKITVPISITLFILSSYILLGGLLFKTLEEWSILDGVYFCFITLSTIGLGDLVPGNSINDSDTQAEFKLVGCSFYLLMGLSLIAMCFNLMQEEVTAKFRKLAVRLGIIDDPNYW